MQNYWFVLKKIDFLKKNFVLNKNVKQLVGTKCDLREDKETIAKLESQNMTMVSKSEAQKMVILLFEFFFKIFFSNS